jgi:prepilin-type N-terminal cleavage/methylation domain-containing protein
MSKSETHKRPDLPRSRGVTLVELMVAMLASSIMFLAVTGVLAGNHKQWNQTYERTLGDVPTDAYVTRQTFDRLVREASISHCNPLEQIGPPMTLYVYAGTPLTMRRYARFVINGTDLVLEEGDLDLDLAEPTPKEPPDSEQVLARHVDVSDPYNPPRIWRTGPCIHIKIDLDDGVTRMPIAMTATRHNP